MPLLARLLLQARLKGGLVDQQGAALPRLQRKRADEQGTGAATLRSAGRVSELSVGDNTAHEVWACRQGTCGAQAGCPIPHLDQLLAGLGIP